MTAAEDLIPAEVYDAAVRLCRNIRNADALACLSAWLGVRCWPDAGYVYRAALGVIDKALAQAREWWHGLQWAEPPFIARNWIERGRDPLGECP